MANKYQKGICSMLWRLATRENKKAPFSSPSHSLIPKFPSSQDQKVNPSHGYLIPIRGYLWLEQSFSNTYCIPAEDETPLWLYQLAFTSLASKPSPCPCVFVLPRIPLL